MRPKKTLTQIKKSADTAADAAQRLGTHAQIGGQFPQGNELQHVGTTLRQGLVALLRRGGIAVQQTFVNLGQHVFGQPAAQPLAGGIGAVEGFEPFAGNKQGLGAAHRPDRHLRRRIDAHRDIVADELSGKGVTHDMLLSRDVGVHVTESALHDQSAAVAAESLPGEAFAAGETPYDALAADKGGEFRKFGLRYVAVEIHGRKDNPSIWENQTKASNMLCLAAFALLWIAGPGRYAADSRIARRL